MLTPVLAHRWDLSPRDAVALQRELSHRVVQCPAPRRIQTVAGIDVALRGERARAAVVVLGLPKLEEVERVCADLPIEYPYVPGLLSFREAPAILQAISRLRVVPDVLMFDGQGYAHPRRMGIATHIGLLLDHPTVGCAKSRLCGSHGQPGPERSSYSLLRTGDEVVGAVLRTRRRVKPVFVSVGHRMGLGDAVRLVLRCGRGYRLPEPTRWAHRVATGHV